MSNIVNTRDNAENKQDQFKLPDNSSLKEAKDVLNKGAVQRVPIETSQDQHEESHHKNSGQAAEHSGSTTLWKDPNHTEPAGENIQHDHVISHIQREGNDPEPTTHVLNVDLNARATQSLDADNFSDNATVDKSPTRQKNMTILISLLECQGK